MRHLKSGRRLSRTTAHRKALMSNLCKAILEHGRIETTVSKAKELRKEIERLITLGKAALTAARRPDVQKLEAKSREEYLAALSVAARRTAFAQMRDRTAVNKLFNDVAPKFEKRDGGYTRIIKKGRRVGDAGYTAVIELVEGGPSVD